MVPCWPVLEVVADCFLTGWWLPASFCLRRSPALGPRAACVRERVHGHACMGWEGEAVVKWYRIHWLPTAPFVFPYSFTCDSWDHLPHELSALKPLSHSLFWEGESKTSTSVHEILIFPQLTDVEILYPERLSPRGSRP